MTIRKSKADDIDIEGLMQEIDNDHQVEEQAAAIDKRLEELRAVQYSLQTATTALNAATDRADSIIKRINTAIDQLQTKKLGVSVHPDSLKALTEATDNFAAQVGRQLKTHRDKQLEQQRVHEQRLADTLQKSRGLWISHTWLKILFISFLVYSLLVILYVKLGR